MVGVVIVALGRAPEWIICTGLSNRMLAGRMSMPGCILLHLLTNQEVLPWLAETGGGMLLSKHPSSSVFAVNARWSEGLMRCWDTATPEFLLNPPSVRPLIRIRSLKLHPDVQTPLLRENTFPNPEVTAWPLYSS